MNLNGVKCVVFEIKWINYFLLVWRFDTVLMNVKYIWRNIFGSFTYFSYRNNYVVLLMPQLFIISLTFNLNPSKMVKSIWLITTDMWINKNLIKKNILIFKAEKNLCQRISLQIVCMDYVLLVLNYMNIFRTLEWRKSRKLKEYSRSYWTCLEILVFILISAFHTRNFFFYLLPIQNTLKHSISFQYISLKLKVCLWILRIYFSGSESEYTITFCCISAWKLSQKLSMLG